jgi:ketosteroid isomerase-like protein
MNDVDPFIAEVVPRLRADVEAVHNGDIGPRLELWSHEEPVTLFGAMFSAKGRTDVEAVFEKLATTFFGSRGLDYEVVAAGSSGDLGYVVALEHSSVATTEEGTKSYTLRVTTVLRREDGVWKVVHRHGDGLPADGVQSVARQTPHAVP